MIKGNFRTKTALKPFFISLLFSLALGIATVGVAAIIFGVNLLNNSGFNINGLKLGDSITLDTIKEQIEYDKPWLSRADVEVYYNDGHDNKKTTSLLTYSKEDHTFKAVGVGEGYITFTSAYEKDYSINVYFSISFEEDTLKNVLCVNYPTFKDDGIISKDELDSVTSLELTQDNSYFDFADFSSLPSLKKLYVPHFINNEALVSNLALKLNDDLHVYVEDDDYEYYMKKSQDPLFIKYRQSLFSYSPDSKESYSIIIDKNGGSFDANDNEDYYPIITDRDGYITSVDKNKIQSLTKTGYHIKDYYLNNITPISLDEKFNNDAYLTVNWESNKYTVRYHLNTINRDEDESKNYYDVLYNYTDKVIFIDEEELANYNDYTSETSSLCSFLGWSKNDNSSVVSYTSEDYVSGLIDEDGAVLDLYAVWRYNSVTVNYHFPHNALPLGYVYNSKDNISIGNEFDPANYLHTDEELIGYDFDQQAKEPLYHNHDSFNIVRYSYESNEINVYAIIRLHRYVVKYYAKDNSLYSSPDYSVNDAVILNNYYDQVEFAKTGYRFAGYYDRTHNRYLIFNDVYNYVTDSTVRNNSTKLNQNLQYDVAHNDGDVIELEAYFVPNTFKLSFISDKDTNIFANDISTTFGSFKSLGTEKIHAVGYYIPNTFTYAGRQYDITNNSLTEDDIRNIYLSQTGFEEDDIRNNTFELNYGRTFTISINEIPINYKIRYHLRSIDDPVVANDYVEKVYTYDTYGEWLTANELSTSVALRNYDVATLVGWSLYSEDYTINYQGNESVYNYTEVKDAIIDVYALWKYKTITVNYHYGDNLSKIFTEYINIDTYFNVAQNVSETGSSIGPLLGWDLDSTTREPVLADHQQTIINNRYIKLQSDTIDYYAIYSNTYTITYKDEDGKSVSKTYWKGDSVDVEVEMDSLTTLRLSVLGKHIIGFTDGNYTYVIEKYQQKYNTGSYRQALINNGFNQDVILTPVYNKDTITIAFLSEANHDIKPYYDVTVEYGSPATLSSYQSTIGYNYASTFEYDGQTSYVASIVDGQLSHDNIHFLYVCGCSDQNKTDYNDFDNIKVKVFINCIAKQYRVIFEGRDSNNNSKKETLNNVTYGSVVTVPSSISKDHTVGDYHYFINGWSCSPLSISLDSSYSYTHYYDQDLVFTASYGNEYVKTCITDNVFITMADGSSRSVRDVNLGDEVMVWDFEKGQLTSSFVMYVEHYNKDCSVLSLYFDDGTSTEMIQKHNYFDLTLRKWIEVTDHNYEQYIGHEFVKINELGEVSSARLLNGVITDYDDMGINVIITAYHLNFINDGFLSTEGDTVQLVSVFDIDDNELKYDEEKINYDIETYGYGTYEECEEYFAPDEFELFNGKMILLGVKKGVVDFDYLLRVYKYQFVVGEWYEG